MKKGAIVFAVLVFVLISSSVSAFSFRRTEHCSDPDGQNFFTRGIATYSFDYWFRSETRSLVDVCSDGNLTESYCDGKKLKVVNYGCEHGCENGACLTRAPSPDEERCFVGGGSYRNYYRGWFRWFRNLYDYKPRGSCSLVVTPTLYKARCGAGAISRQGACDNLEIGGEVSSLAEGDNVLCGDAAGNLVSIVRKGNNLTLVLQAFKCRDCIGNRRYRRGRDEYQEFGCEVEIPGVCTDTDGGLAYNVIGKVVAKDMLDYDDTCSGPNTVKEYSCDGGQCIGNFSLFEFMNDGALSVKVRAPLKDGMAQFNVLYGNGSVFTGVGGSDYQKFTVSGSATLSINESENEWFVASYSDGVNFESYLLDSHVDLKDNQNRTSFRNKVTGMEVCQDKVAGDTCYMGNVEFVIEEVGKIGPEEWVVISATPGVTFDRVFAEGGQYIVLPTDSDVAEDKEHTFVVRNTTSAVHVDAYKIDWDSDGDIRVKNV
jgi:hypothetical protein